MELRKSDFYEMADNERRDSLSANCEEVLENFSYSRELTQEEKDQRLGIISQNLEKVENLKEETKELNQRKKILHDEAINLNKEVISGQLYLNETLYKLTNLDTGMYEFINREGFVVKEERIKGPHSVNMFRKVVNE